MEVGKINVHVTQLNFCWTEILVKLGSVSHVFSLYFGQVLFLCSSLTRGIISTLVLSLDHWSVWLSSGDHFLDSFAII